MSVSKVIITNESAGITKYGKSHWAKIGTALKKLIAADLKRGIATQIIRIDSQRDMDRFQGKAVKKSNSPSQVKRAIDAIFSTSHPHYILLLGGPDLIPHVKLRNPIDPSQDEDKTVPSDLPYACDARYSLDAAKFIGPTRVLGRLPDITGSAAPDYLITLIETACEWVSRSANLYKKYFGVTASVWRGSTRKNVKKLFGSTKPLQISPPDQPKWSKAKLRPRMHFINCHGAQSDFHFYGDPDFPIAHYSDNLIDSVSEGTVATAECCYGAMLFNPNIQAQTSLPICNRYLEQKAYGFLGSTNIAWGSDSGILLADQICQFFNSHIQEGASLGRSLLEARQEFVIKNGPMDPWALKTLAQFTLLGDPSIHPVKKGKSPQPKPVTLKKSFLETFADHLTTAKDAKQLFQKSLQSAADKVIEKIDRRSDRRIKLFKKGLELTRKIAVVDSDQTAAVASPKIAVNLLKAYAKDKSLGILHDATTYVVEEAADWVAAKTNADRRRGDGNVRFIVAMLESAMEPNVVFSSSQHSNGLATKTMKKAIPKLIRKRMLVAKERNGKIESINEYFSR